jgi:hypothetical protein
VTCHHHHHQERKRNKSERHDIIFFFLALLRGLSATQTKNNAASIYEHKSRKLPSLKKNTPFQKHWKPQCNDETFIIGVGQCGVHSEGWIGVCPVVEQQQQCTTNKK